MRSVTGITLPKPVNCCGESCSDEAPRVILPHFEITSDDLPEMKNWKIGEIYPIMIQVKQKEIGTGKDKWSENDGDSDKILHAEFEIVALEVTKETYSEEYARVRSSAPRN